MKPYELTYIISSSIKSEEAEDVKKDLELYIQNKEGVILKSIKSTPQSLAYPVKKHSSGYFATLEFQIAETAIKELKEKLEKDTKILRHFIIVKKPAKIMKKRRTRKPLLSPEATLKIEGENSEVYTQKQKKSDAKVELGDIEKKLDEILSE